MRTTSFAAARGNEATTGARTLYMALELSLKSWKLGFTDGGNEPRVVSVPARDYPKLAAEIAKALARFKMPTDAPIVSCYEAGRESFSVHRVLVGRGIDNRVVNPASIRVERQARRRKTDRLDASMLVKQLAANELKAIDVPTPSAEDARQLPRELLELKDERTMLTNRIRSLLFAQGYDLSVTTQREVEALELGIAGGDIKLGPNLVDRIGRELIRLALLNKQISELEAARKAALVAKATKAAQQVIVLMTLCGIGIESASILAYELFSWRKFPNRKKLASFLGLTPTPYASGQMSRELGISKAGPARLRALMIELAWLWVRFQPDSELSRWFKERFKSGSSRMRRTGIVAVARKLLIALWHFLEKGVVPKGARTRPAPFAGRPTSRQKKLPAATAA